MKKLSLGAQFELNREYWNFREPTLIFFSKSIGSNQG